MEQQVIFRAYQEQTEQDHNDAQTFTRNSLDHIVGDFLTTARRWAGFVVQKTGQVELSISQGRITDNAGAVYALRASTSESLSERTAAASLKCVSVSAYPFEDPTGTNEEQRDYLTDVANDIIEPKSVSMTRSRDAILVFTEGAEGADAKPPSLPSNHVEIARVIMDTTQIVSVTMVESSRAVSSEALALRAAILEAFKTQIEPRVTSLAADLAGLQQKVDAAPGTQQLLLIKENLAKIDAALRFPSTALGVDFNPFLSLDKLDVNNTALLGFDAKIGEGVRFPDANKADLPLDIFAQNDPNASITNGVLLPKYTEVNKLYTGAYDSEVGIAQYGFQTFELEQGYISRTRIRYGGYTAQCSNGAYTNSTYGPSDAASLYDFTETLAYTAASTYVAHPGANDGAYVVRTDYYWQDTWKEPYSYIVTVPHSIVGAQVAQSFLISNDMWATSLEFYVTAKAAAEDIHVAVVELTNGTPDLSKTVLKTVYPSTSILVGWNKCAITPTYFKKGKRYAVVLVSNANHKLGMTSGQNYLDGTFFYSTDQVYYQGDLTKDLMLKVNGAQFNSSQVTISLKSLNLDGGFRYVDILAEMWVPGGTQLIFEIRPAGAGDWKPIAADVADSLTSVPVFAEFRARFVCTTGLAPAIHLGTGRVRLGRPKQTRRCVSDLKSFPATKEIHVKTVVEGFMPAANTEAEKLWVNGAYVSPVSTQITLQDVDAKRYEYHYTYTFAAAITQFRVVDDGTTTSAFNTYHIATQSVYGV